MAPTILSPMDEQLEAEDSRPKSFSHVSAATEPTIAVSSSEGGGSGEEDVRSAASEFRPCLSSRPLPTCNNDDASRHSYSPDERLLLDQSSEALVETDGRKRRRRSYIQAATKAFDDDFESAVAEKQMEEEEPRYARVNLRSKRNPESSRGISEHPEERESMLTTFALTATGGNNDALHRTYSLRGQDEEEMPNRFSQQVITAERVKRGQRKANDALQAVISALYCKFLVILGLAFPLAEVISDNVPQGYYQLFYVYLFVGSLVFLFVIYIDLLLTRRRQRRLIADVLVKSKRIDEEEEEIDARKISSACNNSIEDDVSSDGEDLIPRPRVHYGSFYLRLGAVLFGIGSMIYSGIEIGMFLELNLDEDAKCKNLLSVLRPILQMAFVFVQMYFVFLNQKMNIYKHKLFSRIGLMHMMATNLCVWLNVLILETNHGIQDSYHKQHHDDNATDSVTEMNQHIATTTEGVEIPFLSLSQATPLGLNNSSNHFDLRNLISLCHRKRNIMSKLLADSGPFLFPCTIEYSLICAAVLFVMWKNIDEEHEYYKFQKMKNKITTKRATFTRQLDGTLKSIHHYSVDCTHANRGLFGGIFFMVLTIISLIIFFVLISSEDTTLHSIAIIVASVTELVLYCFTAIAVLVGMWQIRSLWYDNSRKLELDNLLLVVAQTGVFIYTVFCIIGSFFQLHEHLLAFLASLAILMQTTMQTIFILDASNRYAYCSDQVKRKPGREVVTFLMVCNLAMWAINTLETNRTDSHPIQVKFYGGDWTWPIITHISMPLAIFYRFHSTVCLCEIWKKSFKFKSSAIPYI